jgi:hypothetical protein
MYVASKSSLKIYLEAFSIVLFPDHLWPFTDGILGYQFTKRLESFALCYSQSVLLEDSKENHTLLWF